MTLGAFWLGMASSVAMLCFAAYAFVRIVLNDGKDVSWPAKLGIVVSTLAFLYGMLTIDRLTDDRPGRRPTRLDWLLPEPRGPAPIQNDFPGRNGSGPHV